MLNIVAKLSEKIIKLTQVDVMHVEEDMLPTIEIDSLLMRYEKESKPVDVATHTRRNFSRRINILEGLDNCFQVSGTRSSFNE